jgi:hypothetical protein
MPDTLTDRRRRHNLQVTEYAFGSGEGFTVIPGRASARTRNLEIPGSMLRIALE